MKNIRIIGMVMLAVLSMPAMRISAQVTDTKLQLKLDEVKEKMVEFDTEHMIDSLDQEKLPRLVSGGVLAGANLSNLLNNKRIRISSNLNPLIVEADFFSLVRNRPHVHERRTINGEEIIHFRISYRRTSRQGLRCHL